MRAAAMLVLSFVALCMGATPSRAEETPAIATITGLGLYWNGQRSDNFTTGTTQGAADATAAGYSYVRKEACILIEQAPNTRPLYTYWSAQRQDNFALASPESLQSAIDAGYTYIRVEGYVYSRPRFDTVPLYLFWNPDRGDNLTVASDAGVQSALTSGYKFIRIEGYVLPAWGC
jgi:hypothetical protein